MKKVPIEEIREKATTAYKPPFEYDKNGGMIWGKDSVWALTEKEGGLQVRGWGHLTGGGAMGLPEDEAAVIQDAFAEYTAHCLNTHQMLLDALEECLPYVKQALAANLKSLEDADEWSQFYGEDICSGPIIARAEKAIEAASFVEVSE